MPSPPQFSLRSLLIATTVFAVMLSMTQTIGVGIVCGLTALGVLAVLCRSEDILLVPIALCAGVVLLALAFPVEICERDFGHLLDALVIAAVSWDLVGYRAATRGASRSFDYRRKSRASGGANTFPAARLVRWLVLATMAGAFVLLACAGYLATGESFRSEAAGAWPTCLTLDMGGDPFRAARHFIWSVNALAVLGVAAAVCVRCTPQGPGREVRLRHVANAHVVGLLILSVTMLRALMASFHMMNQPPPVAYINFFPALYTLVASLPIALVLFTVSFLVLGAYVPRYLREHGWLLALGLGAVALAGAVWIGIGVAMYPELR